MKACMTTTSFPMIINDRPSSFFRTSRGLRQGDLLTLLLLIIITEILNRLLEKAREKNLLKGVELGRGDQNVDISHLFFADDILIFCQPDEKMILNLICVLLCFLAISELNINLNKFKLVMLEDKGDVNLYNCQSSTLGFFWELNIKM